MGDRSYEYIMAINKHRVLSEASKELRVSQSTLTKFLQKEQKRLNVELFQKIDGRFIPTYAGNMYIKSLEQIKKIEDRFESKINEIATEQGGVLRIAGSSETIEYLTDKVIPKFATYYPEMRVNLIETNTEKMYHMLDNLHIDIATSAIDQIIKNYTYHRAKTIPYHIIAHKDHEIFKEARTAFRQKYIIRADALNDKKFVVLPEDSIIRVQMEKMLYQKNIHYKISANVQTIHTAVDCISANIGIGYLPEIYTSRHIKSTIRQIEIEDTKDNCEIYAFTRKEIQGSQSVKKFIEIFTTEYHLL